MCSTQFRSPAPISRRRLLLSAALASAAAGLTACTTTESSTTAGASSPTPQPNMTPTAPPTTPSTDPHAELLRSFHHRVPTRWATSMPGIIDRVDTAPGSRTLALTFDACGGPEGAGIDDHLISVLREHQVPATLFLNSRWIDAHPDYAAALASDELFSLENHGTTHLPLSVTGQQAYGITGTADVAAATREIIGNQELLRTQLGVTSTWFRSGTAHYDDVAVALAQSLGVQIAGFGANLDGGATLSAAQVSRQLQNAPDGAICLAHMNQPQGGTAEGIAQGIATLRHDNVRFVHLL